VVTLIGLDVSHHNVLDEWQLARTSVPPPSEIGQALEI